MLVLLLGDSTLRNKWEYVKGIDGSATVSSHCVRCGMMICYREHAELRNPHMSGELIKGILKNLPNLSTYTVAVTLINFGLHHLHLYPARKVFHASIPAFERSLREHVVLTSRTVSAAGNWKHSIYFKLIDAICTDNFVGEYAHAFVRWRTPTNADLIRDHCCAHVQNQLNITKSDGRCVRTDDF